MTDTPTHEERLSKLESEVASLTSITKDLELARQMRALYAYSRVKINTGSCRMNQLARSDEFGISRGDEASEILHMMRMFQKYRDYIEAMEDADSYRRNKESVKSSV